MTTAETNIVIVLRQVLHRYYFIFIVYGFIADLILRCGIDCETIKQLQVLLICYMDKLLLFCGSVFPNIVVTKKLITYIFYISLSNDILQIDNK